MSDQQIVDVCSTFFILGLLGMLAYLTAKHYYNNWGGMMIKLGRKAIKTDSRTLKLSRYLEAGLPPAPPSRDWTKGRTDWGMMKNDELGDCTIAGIGHAVQVWSLNSVGLEITPTDDTVLSYYEKWDGYVQGDLSTDQGGIELDVLTGWKRDTFDGHALLAFADPDVKNLAEIRQAINMFGGVYIGMEVPNFIMADEPPANWDIVADDGGIDGGHAVFCCGYDENTISFISWGKVYRMTNAYWAKYVDESHALLSPLWINSKTGAPSGFNLTQLQADLAIIK